MTRGAFVTWLYFIGMSRSFFDSSSIGISFAVPPPATRFVAALLFPMFSRITHIPKKAGLHREAECYLATLLISTFEKRKVRSRLCETKNYLNKELSYFRYICFINAKLIKCL